MSRFEQKIKKLEELLRIARQACDKESEMKANNFLGIEHYSLSKYKEAIKFFEKGLSIAVEIGDKDGEGTAYGNLGAVYEKMGKYDDAIKYQEKGLSITREIGDKGGEGTAYGNLGIAYYRRGKYDEAIKYQEKRLSIALEIGDKAGEGKAYGNLGTIYGDIGKYDEAIKYQEKGLSLAIELGDKAGEGTAYGNFGTFHSDKGKYDEAIKYQEKRLNIAIEIGDKDGEGTAYGNLGTVYSKIGKHDKAIKYQEERLRIAKEMGDKAAEGIAYGNLGIVYSDLGKHDEAIKYHEKRLSIAIEIGDKAGEGTAYGNLGTVYIYIGKYNEAIKYQEKKLSIAIEIGDKAGEGTACGNLGVVYNYIQKYDEAIKYSEKQLSIAIEIGDKFGEGTAYGNLGTVYSDIGKYDEAIKYHEKGLRIAKEIGNKQGEARVLHNLGFCYRNLTSYHEDDVDTANRNENMKKSANYFQDALQRWEWIFDHLEGQDKFKISIFDTFIVTYQELMQVQIDLKQIEEALLVSERGRARALGDVLDPKCSLNQGFVCRSNLMTYDDIEALLRNNKYSIIFFALYNDYVIQWSLRHKKLLSFHQSHEECLAKLVDAAFDEMQVKVPVNSEDRSLDSLEEDDDNFVCRDVAEEPLLISVQNNKGRLVSKGTQDNLRPRCVWLEEGEEDQRSSSRDHLKELYEILVTPLQENLVEEEDLVIIPDGLLFKVPFAALRDPHTKLYLSDTKRVRLAPSLTVLRVLQESPAASHSSTSTLIVGNPAVEKVMVEGEKQTFKRLPAAEREALKLSTLMGVAPLIGDQATKQVSLLQTARVLPLTLTISTLKPTTTTTPAHTL